ncbi:CDP-archaeol synthase [Candidatus Woesearchaeota archaeon]|nr:CDP-archaeol synthase [Candidatus Woesearchaeota archaeon]
MIQVLQLAYLMLPAYAANMVPELVKGVRILDYPIDNGITWRGQRLLGSHKTWRGLFFGVLAAVLVAYVQSVFAKTPGLSPYDYSQWFAWGALLGFGALFGDSVKSLVKRQAHRRPGQSWPPWDQLDFALGSIAFGSIVYFPGWTEAAVIFLVSFLGHLGVSHTGYWLGLKEAPW